MSDDTLRPGEARVRMAFKCTHCGAGFHGADALFEHYREQHPGIHLEQTKDTIDVDMKRPIYEGKILTYSAGDQILWMERIADLERQITELRARLDAMEGGK